MSKETVSELIEKYGKGRFHEMLEDGYESEDDPCETSPELFKQETGLEFKVVFEGRSSAADYCDYIWRWQVGEEFFEHRGTFSSWDGTYFPEFDSFTQVKPLQVVKTTWVNFDTQEPIKGQLLEGKFHE